jgi:hypothetical protein
MTLMSSGLLYKSTSRISKSMPFSNKTKRQRWENGQVVPEYKTIILGTPKNQKSWQGRQHRLTHPCTAAQARGDFE